jgi:hypothetical protein
VLLFVELQNLIDQNSVPVQVYDMPLYDDQQIQEFVRIVPPDMLCCGFLLIDMSLCLMCLFLCPVR